MKQKNEQGVRVPFWVWASAIPTFKKSGQVKEQAPTIGKNEQSSKDLPVLDAEVPDVNQLLVENPDMSASTFLNLLKSRGFQVVKSPEMKQIETKEEKVEADAAASNVPALRANESSWVFRSKFIESAASDNGIGPTIFKVILLKEGLGNFKDGYFYSKDALKTAMPVFEGKKIYADHPSDDEDKNRPERSVKDVLGHFENVQVEEAEDGTSLLVGNVKILPDKPYEWARALMRHAVQYSQQYPDKDFIGLSINASGDAAPIAMDDFLKEGAFPESSKVKLMKAKEMGLETIRVVNAITEAVSCDLVTEAGAGGRVLNILESRKGTKMSEENKKENEEKKEAVGAQDQEKPAHDDAAQDVELIKGMLKKHLGDDAAENEEAMKQADEAYKAACESGMESEEALETVGKALKMSSIMKAKKEKQEAEEAAKKESEEKCEAEEGEEKKESAKVLKLTAENSALKERLAKIDLEKYIDKKLAESKLPMSVTKAFKEAAGDIRNEKQFDRDFALFVKARENQGGEAGSFWTLPEKQVAQKTDTLSFEDCVK